MGAVGLEDAVRVAHREGEGVGGLLVAHDLPHEQEALDGLVERLRAVGGHLLQRRDHVGKLFSALTLRIFHLRAGDGGVAAREHHHGFQRALHGAHVGALFVVRLDGDLRVKVGDELVDAVFEGGTQVRHYVARHLLHEEGDLAGVALGLGIGVGKHAAILGVAVVGAHLFDALAGEFLVGLNVVKHGGGVTVTGEGLHLEAGVDQRVGTREGVALRAGEDGVLTDGERQLLQGAVEQVGGALHGPHVRVFGLVVHVAFLDEKPAVQSFEAPLLAEEFLGHLRDAFRGTDHVCHMPLLCFLKSLRRRRQPRGRPVQIPQPAARRRTRRASHTPVPTFSTCLFHIRDSGGTPLSSLAVAAAKRS